MITIPEVEQLAFQGSSPKNLTLQFPFSTLTNENIFMESAQLEQSVCEESNLTFGMVYSSCFSVTIFDDGVSRLGQRVLPVLSVDDGNGGTYTRSLGRYVVKSDKRTSDKLYRELKCYDFLTEILSTDFSAWHNSMPNHCKIKKYRNDFFAHIGIAQESITLPNDEVTVPRYKATELTGADILAGILQVNGAFGFMAINGKFKYVLPKTTHDYLIDDNSFVQGSLVYEDEPIRPITGVTMKGFSDDYGDDDSFSRAEISVGNANGAVYTIEDNNFVHAIYESQRKDICNNLLALLNGYTYYPTNVEVPAYIGLEPGDVFKIETSDKDIYFPVLKRTLKGISALQDELAAEGESDSSTAGSVSSGVSSAQLAINQVRDSVSELLAQKASIEAQDAAISANNSANNALVQLSVVEDVAGTLRWISEHGSYVPTTDTTVIEGSVYFIYENGDYIPIANPDPSANPSQEGWYVLDVTESQAKYIMAHLAVTSAGLWVLPVNQMAEHPLVDSDGDQIIDSDNNPIVDFSEDPQHASGYKVLLSGTGMTVYNDEGASVAFYGETTRIGAEYENHIFIDNDSVDIMKGNVMLAKFDGGGVTLYSQYGKIAEFVKSNSGQGELHFRSTAYQDSDVELSPGGLFVNTFGDDTVGRAYAAEVNQNGVFKASYTQSGILNNGSDIYVGTFEPRSITYGSDTAPTSTWKKVDEIELPEGVWLITFGCGFSQNATGDRYVVLTNATSSISASRHDAVVRACSGSPTTGHGVRLMKIGTSGAKYNLYVYQNSGTSLTVSPYVQAVKLA